MGVKSLSLLLVVFVVAVYGAVQDQSTKIFPGVLRDQAPDTMCVGDCRRGSCGSANGGKGFKNTDFEIVLGTYQNGEKGIVGAQCDAGNNWQNCGKIGDDRTPIYAYSNPPRGSPGNNTRSPDSFYTWFHHTNQTKAINYNITLTQAAGNTYQYVNNSFFPIDGMGWNDYCSGHNYGYCFEGHSRFGYQGGEVFAFTGDDDVWVYINNMLVIDLGALHQELSMSVNLDDIQPPLVQGSNYLIDFFYCERHTTESQIRLTTSIGLYCAYTDWCGVCEGTGLSCCTAEHAKLCDDGDPCTIDKCGVRVAPPEGCEHTQIVCTPKDKCHNAICANGTCAQVPITCNDGKACTNDTCSPTLGCQYTSYVCNDNSLCTDDACVEPTGQCQFTPISCTGTNACRNYTCSPTRGCQSTTITCNPNNKCTTPYTCTDTVNGCPTAPITCTPPTPCHNAVCDPAVGCNFSNKTCSDGLVCTTDSCNPTTGACVYTDVSCDDGNPCTKDSCSESAGGCVYLKSACTPALCQDAVCVDFEGCRYTPKSCSDGLKCTQDICNSNGTCVNPPVVCTPADKCHTSVCNPSTGSCDVNVVNCDDSDPCTSDVCDPLSGCVHTKVTCNDNLTCTTDACDPSSGCVYTPITCAPDSTLCNCVGGVCEENTACDDHDGCTVDSCDSNSGCSYAPKSCDDDNICTVDSCLSPSGNCSNVKGDVNTICGAPPNQCFSWDCAKDTGCSLSAKICNDGNPCTTDLCVNATGECQHTYIGLNCENCGGNPCTFTDFCNPSICNNATSQCEIKPVDCDDGSVCTNDFCNPLNGSCYFTTIPCADNTDPCNPKFCKPLTGCVVEPVACNSNNPCNIDSCSDGTCNRTSIECPVANKCIETANCNPNTGKCETTPLVKECDDNNNCTVDSCDPATGDCIYTPLSCSTDICSPEMCNQKNGKCESTIPPCDDGNACTVDENVCVPGVGVQCQHYTNTSLCDDGDACTSDECSGNSTAICTHVPTVCASVDACHVSLGCDPQSGYCVNVSKNCENQTVDWCSPFSCDSMAGCIEIPRTCPNKDIGCYVAVCRSNGSMNGTCELDRVSNWGSAKGKNGVLCPLLYDDAAKAAAIAGGAVAGIVIGAVAAAGLIGFGGKKGYDYLMAKNSPIGDVGNNPLYAPSGGSGENPLFKS